MSDISREIHPSGQKPEQSAANPAGKGGGPSFENTRRRMASSPKIYQYRSGTDLRQLQKSDERTEKQSSQPE